jgi:hypothetical protein
MKSLKFAESIEIVSVCEELFDVTQDYSKRLLWDTFLKEARLLGNISKPEKGVKAWCVAKNGLGMETEYVSFARPRVTAIKMTKGPYVFADFAASWTFKEMEGETTLVTFLYSFKLRSPFNLVGGLFKTILRRNVRNRLSDLKNYVEGKT